MKSNIKKWFIIGTVFIILFGTLLHFVYKWSGNNTFVGIIGAVNESTWEHLKLLFWPAFLFSIVEYIVIGYKYNKYVTGKAITFYVGIFLIITLFYTYTGIFGDNYLVIDILIFLFSVIFSQYIGYKYILSKNHENNLINILSLGMIMLLLFAFVVFTFDPPKISLFMDPLTGDYGI